MRRIGITVRVLLVIALAGLGLPCWTRVCWQRGILGWLHWIYGGTDHEKNRISQ